jgi:ATP-dependent helicase/nuclease subunit B
MAPIPAPEVDAWLRAGGMVVAASDRAARSVRTAFHRARRAQSLNAWPAPAVLDWSTFIRDAWANRAVDDRLLLNGAQEQSLWSRIVGESGHAAGWLESPRRRLAALAMQAHALLAAYGPDRLQAAARRSWQQDAAAFSQWLSAFDEVCNAEGLVSANRLPLELLSLLENDSSARPALVLAGFDRILPVQRRILDAWGDWRLIAAGEPANDIVSYVAPTRPAELIACARWSARNLQANPQSRVLVIAQDASQNRGEIERAFLRQTGAVPTLQYEFSLGVPLRQVPLARGALQLLRWLDDTLEEHEIDWLAASETATASRDESAALQSYMRALRRRGRERVQWTLEAFLGSSTTSAALPSAWVRRMTSAQRRLRETAPSSRNPLDWAGLVPQLLDEMDWGGVRPGTSVEFQAASRWQQAVDLCGSLGFDGRRVPWREFLSELTRTLDETLFAEESQDAPVLIAGAAESAGLAADAIWFLGADENAWPAGGSAHPLIPIEVQREAHMPHASPQLDWELAESMTRRLLTSARQIRFSYARQREGAEMRPSRLIFQVRGNPRPLPPELEPAPAQRPLTAPFDDNTRVPLPAAPAGTKSNAAQLSLFDAKGEAQKPPPIFEVPGGSTVLTAQSQCAFKAFATARLEARGWEQAEFALTPAQRGKLLHSVLHSVWGGPPHGIRGSSELHDKGVGLERFVEEHVQRAFEDEMPAGVREHIQKRYLELEAQRLTRVVTAWLEYERKRLPFSVTATEVDATTTIAGLTLKLRLDRVDRLNDDSLLVVDYKTGNVDTKLWDLPRPDDVQLPLYAGFALDKGETLGGLVFAKVRPGNQMCFTGRVMDACSTLDSTLNGTSTLVKNALTPQQMSEWRKTIEQLARDFVAGRADVDPRDYPKTCERCGLYTLCRVKERDEEVEEDETIEAEAADD